MPEAVNIQIACDISADRRRFHRRPLFLGATVEKDTITFALLLSVIDFFLSMVMITGIGLILHLLPKLNRLGTLDEVSMRRGH